MAKYAIIVSDTGLLPGSNGMINSMLLYGMAKKGIEFHYIWDGDIIKKYLQRPPSFGVNTEFIHTIKLQDLRCNGYPKHPNSGELAWYPKMYRYLYAVRELGNYDAVAIFDADMQIVNDISDFFEIAAATGRLLLPNNDYSRQEYDASVAEAIRGAATPPLHNMPSFFNPRIWRSVMEDIIGLSISNNIGDMAALSLSLLKNDSMKYIHVLPNVLWVLSMHFVFQFYMRWINDTPFISIHGIGDRIYAFHRRWWMKSECEKFVEEAVRFDERYREVARANALVFHNMTRYLNQLYIPIEWNMDEWGIYI